MIIAETAEHVRFVTQPAHADLAGRFADHWGNERFARPDPYAATTMAAYNHDTGWWEYDRRPHLHDDETPVDFTELPPETWITLYESGIDAVVDLDAYAGLLVSLHGAGLRRKRYGLSPSWPDTPPEYSAFVDREETRQERLCAELKERGAVSEADADLLATLHESGTSEGAGSRLWANYRLLQAWDTLSLALCTTTTPPSYGEIAAVPTREGSADETLSLERVGDGEIRVSPYPFDTAPLAVSVPTRTVARSDFDDEQSLLQAYYSVEREREEFTLRPEWETSLRPE